MEVHEELVMGSNHHKHIIKGKRTKRQKLALTMASTSSTTAEAGGSGGTSDISGGFNSADFTRSTELEQDTANCLILLAQGRHSHHLSEDPLAAANVFPCKTCDRSFASFQALGGHRASHTRPKPTEDKKVMMVPMDVQELTRFNHKSTTTFTTSTTLSLQISSSGVISSNNKLSKLHECSICGAEFTSGQALGGHMRRHRTLPPSMAAATSCPNGESQELKKPRNHFSLDLNLPAAPEDDCRESKFPFGLKEQVSVFSASALVDCHH